MTLGRYPRGIRNCHARNFHSVVLSWKQDGTPKIRVFFAEEGHNLWRNDLSQTSPISVAIHSHRTDVTFVHLVGEMINVRCAPALDDNSSAFKADLFKYGSKIVDGSCSFSRLKSNQSLMWITQSLEDRGIIMMHASALHTVYVPKDQFAAWLVIEGAVDPSYDSRVYSNDPDLERFDASDMYQPMSDEECDRLLLRLDGSPLS